MPKRYLGNIITDTPTAPAGPYENDAASGVWSLAEAETYTAAGLWPTAGNANPLAGDTAFFAGDSLYTNSIEYVAISTLGNSVDFGDMTFGAGALGSVSSSTRAVFGGGRQDGSTPGSAMCFITMSSLGNASVFGNLTTARRNLIGCSNSTRGVFMGGANASNTMLNIMDYITIASTGDATDFGDLLSITQAGGPSCSNTRGIYGIGFNGSPTNTIQYITIASTGNATDFGDATSARLSPANGIISSGTRGVFAAGDTSGSGRVNIIDYITIASTGNATDFGDLSRATEAPYGASNLTRGLIAGGANVTTTQIDYITIASTGNSSDFGDLLDVGLTYGGAGISNSHGGLAA